MFTRQATVVAIVGVILAACSAGADSAPSPPTSPSPSHRPPSLARVSPSPTIVAPSPTPVATPTPSPTTKPAAKPPEPTGVAFRERFNCLSDSCHRAKYTQTVTWKAPLKKSLEIRVYGITECLAEPANAKPGTRGPCLVEHTTLPRSARTLLATAPASAGKVSWSWTQETGCDIGHFASDPDGPVYYSIVLAAYNSADNSVFAIAEPGEWYVWPEGEMPC